MSYVVYVVRIVKSAESDYSEFLKHGLGRKIEYGLC